MADGSARRTLLARALALAVFVVSAGAVAGVVLWQRAGEPEVVPWRTPAAVPAAPALSPVPVDSAPPPEPTAGEAVAEALAGAVDDPALGERTGVSVVDASGHPVYEHEAGLPITPASTLKVLTGAAVLATLGPDARLSTSVVTGAAPDEVVLVGGGDPSLTRRPGPGRPGAGGAAGGGTDRGPERARGGAPDVPASADALLPGEDTRPARLPDLAAATADALRRQGTTRVRLAVDDSRFAGPTVNPTWPGSYVGGGYVAPVTALAADAGRVEVDGLLREPDPSLAAGRLFARMLERNGVEVAGGLSRTTAPEDADLLAREESQPVATLVETMLETSDNDYAEVLLRQAGRATGHQASFRGGVAAVEEVLGELDIDPGAMHQVDGSGLSRANRVPPRVLTATLAEAANAAHPELRPLVAGLPVAGFTGTLDERFDDADGEPARGVLRAKTGTLTGVGSLAGLVQDRDGRLLVFALLADQGSDQTAVEDALDETAAALAACGCVPQMTPPPGGTSP